MSTAAGAATLRLATRGSALALAQARLAGEALSAAGLAVAAPMIIRTSGDRRPDVPLDRLQGQGWFTAELERALLDGKADVAVHSAKDLPTELAPGLRVAALLERADVRDGVITRDGRRLGELDPGDAVGTSSARRIALLKALHPQLRAVPMRGNVDTRLRKLDSGEVAALLLACAGLDRLGSGDRLIERLDPTAFVPAPAQGAIALEVLAGSEVDDLLTPLDHVTTRAAVNAERAVLRALGGGCLLPLGVWARFEGPALRVTAALAVEDEVRRAELDVDPADPESAGEAVAAALRGL